MTEHGAAPTADYCGEGSYIYEYGQRMKAAAAWWLVNHAETEYPCYDCHGSYAFPDSGLGMESIQKGKFWWDEPDKTILLCMEHWNIRNVALMGDLHESETLEDED